MEIEFQIFDQVLDKYPKKINQLIYEFYFLNCQQCDIQQKYCLECKNYQCFSME